MTYRMNVTIETATRTIRRTYKGLAEAQVTNARGVVRMLTPVGSTITFNVTAE